MQPGEPSKRSVNALAAAVCLYTADAAARSPEATPCPRDEANRCAGLVPQSLEVLMSLGSAGSMMQGVTSELDQMTEMSAQMQVEQSMYASVSDIANSGASNVKSAAQGS
jgi:hypothetical protein